MTAPAKSPGESRWDDVAVSAMMLLEQAEILVKDCERKRRKSFEVVRRGRHDEGTGC